MSTTLDVQLGWCFERPFPELLAGVVLAEGVTTGPATPALEAALAPILAAADQAGPSESTRQAIRGLLRKGGFKPTGRNKPASEYLVEARRRGEWPAILNHVDTINAFSFARGWPISVLDLDRILALPTSLAPAADGPETPGLELRWGRPGETYIFNNAGHNIDLEGLVGVGRAGGPLAGNPVKDAMHAKLLESTTRTVTIFWASREAASEAEVRAVAASYAALLAETAGATATRSWVVTQP